MGFLNNLKSQSGSIQNTAPIQPRTSSGGFLQNLKTSVKEPVKKRTGILGFFEKYPTPINLITGPTTPEKQLQATEKFLYKTPIIKEIPKVIPAVNSALNFLWKAGEVGVSGITALAVSPFLNKQQRQKVGQHVMDLATGKTTTAEDAINEIARIVEKHGTPKVVKALSWPVAAIANVAITMGNPASVLSVETLVSKAASAEARISSYIGYKKAVGLGETQTEFAIGKAMKNGATREEATKLVDTLSDLKTMKEGLYQIKTLEKTKPLGWEKEVTRLKNIINSGRQNIIDLGNPYRVVDILDKTPSSFQVLPEATKYKYTLDVLKTVNSGKPVSEAINTTNIKYGLEIPVPIKPITTEVPVKTSDITELKNTQAQIKEQLKQYPADNPVSQRLQTALGEITQQITTIELTVAEKPAEVIPPTAPAPAAIPEIPGAKAVEVVGEEPVKPAIAERPKITPALEEVFKPVKEIKPVEEVKPEIKPEVRPTEVKPIPKELEPLIQKAKKYKNIEEFVNEYKIVENEIKKLPIGDRETFVYHWRERPNEIWTRRAKLGESMIKAEFPEPTNFYNQIVKEVKPQYEILNSRGNRAWDKTFDTEEKARNFLNKKITSAAGQLQFSIEKVVPETPPKMKSLAEPFDWAAREREYQKNIAYEKKREQLRLAGRAKGRQSLLTEEVKKIAPQPKQIKAPTVKPGEQGRMLKITETTEKIGKDFGAKPEEITRIKAQIAKLNPKVADNIDKVITSTQNILGNKLSEAGYWDMATRTIGLAVSNKPLDVNVTHELLHAGFDNLKPEEQKVIINEWKSLSLKDRKMALGNAYDYYLGQAKSQKYYSIDEYMTREYFSAEGERIYDGQKPLTFSQRILQLIRKVLRWINDLLRIRKAPSKDLQSAYNKIFSRTGELTKIEKPSPPARFISTEEVPVYQDKFGLTFTRTKVPVEKLISDPKFQPRITESARATEESVYKNGYKEGLVTQPMVVNKIGDDYVVLGGHSRTRGMQRREAEGLSNLKYVTANVYDNLTEPQAKQISRAANQQTQEESLLDKAKSIYESRVEAQPPQVSKANMRKGFTYDDYETLWKLVINDKTGNMRVNVENGVIDEGNALNIAQNANMLRLNVNDVLGLLQVVEESGKGLSYERFNRLAKMMDLAKDRMAGKEAQANLFGKTGLVKEIARIDNEIEKELKLAKEVVNTIKRMKKVGSEHNLFVPEEWWDKKAESERIVRQLEKNQVDTLLAKWIGKPTSTTEHLNKVIEQGREQAAELDKANKPLDTAVESKATVIEDETKNAQVAFGRLQSQVDLSEVDKMISAIPADVSPQEVTRRVAEAMQRKGELMEAGGFKWINGEWQRIGKAIKPTIIPPTGPNYTPSRADLMERVKYGTTGMTPEEVKILDQLDRTIDDSTDKLDKAFKNPTIKQKLSQAISKVVSPMFTFPEMWKKILVPMETYKGFMETETGKVHDVYKKYKIKPHSESDMRIKRLKDGTATVDDVNNVTDTEIKALQELDAITNEWFDRQVKEMPVILDRVRGIRDELAGELEQLRATKKAEGVREAGQIAFLPEEIQLTEETPLDEQPLVAQIANINRILKWQTDHLLTEARWINYYVPRYRITSYDKFRNNYRLAKNFFFRSLEGRTNDWNEAMPQASLLELMDRYIRGMGYNLNLMEMYVNATRQAELYNGNKLIEARQYLQDMKYPRAMATASLIATRAFSSSQLGIRTQIKNFSYGQVMSIAETGKHYFEAWSMMLRNPNAVREILQDKHFMADVYPLIYGTIGTTGYETAAKKLMSVQRNLPSALMMRTVEGINRPIAYLSGYLQGKAQGLTGEELNFHAWNVVAKTQFNYSQYAVPAAFRGKYGRLASQYVLTKLRSQEQVINAVVHKDWKYLLRYLIGATLIFAALSAMWPQAKRVTRKGIEYTKRGIDWLEGVDIFDLRKAISAAGKTDDTLANIYNIATASLSGFMAPIVQMMLHLMRVPLGMDQVYRQGFSYLDNILTDLQGMIPERGVFNDFIHLLRSLDILNIENSKQILNTIIGANELMQELDKKGDTKAVEQLKKDYPISQFYPLAKKYDTKINNEYTKATAQKAKNKKKYKEDKKALKDANAEVDMQRERNIETIMNEFTTELQKQMDAKGVKFSMANILGVQPAYALEADHIAKIAEEGTTPQKLPPGYLPAVAPEGWPYPAMPFSTTRENKTRITYYTITGLTATGTQAGPGIVAVSPDILQKGILKMGDIITIEGVEGQFRVKDKTRPDIKNTIDVWAKDKKSLPEGLTGLNQLNYTVVGHDTSDMKYNITTI